MIARMVLPTKSTMSTILSSGAHTRVTRSSAQPSSASSEASSKSSKSSKSPRSTAVASIGSNDVGGSSRYRSSRNLESVTLERAGRAMSSQSASSAQSRTIFRSPAQQPQLEQHKTSFIAVSSLTTPRFVPYNREREREREKWAGKDFLLDNASTSSASRPPVVFQTKSDM